MSNDNNSVKRPISLNTRTPSSSYNNNDDYFDNDNNDNDDHPSRCRTPSKHNNKIRQKSRSTVRNEDLETSSEEFRRQVDDDNERDNDNDDNNDDDDDDDEPAQELTLKDRQNAINIEHPFGLPIWKPALYKKSRSVTVAADNALHSEPRSHPSSLTTANIAWLILAGWWLSGLCFISSGLLFLVEWTKDQSLWVKLFYDLGWYICWPFGGKYVEGAGPDLQSNEDNNEEQIRTNPVEQNDELSTLLYQNEDDRRPSYGAVLANIEQHKLPFKKQNMIAKYLYYTILTILVAPLMMIVSALSFFTIIPIPMGKLLYELAGYLYLSPTKIRFRPAPKVLLPTTNDDNANDENNQNIQSQITSNNFTVPKLKAGQALPPTRHGETSTVLLCVYNAGSSRYYKFTVGGVNIFFVNLMPLVFLVILDAFLLLPYVEKKGITHGLLSILSSRALLFILSLASVIPLSYFIGMAVASISAQSSIGVGSVINATFGSLIEILIYSFALKESKSSLVEGSLVGSVLAGVLLMPGVSMCAGAIRRKELRFNAKAAGVTSTMLIMAIIGTLTPTLFYQTYGSSQLVCKGCPKDMPLDRPWSCKRCFYQHVDPHTDPFYQTNVKHLMYFCATILVFSYLVGLWFSLRTHASQIWQNPQQLMHGGEQQGQQGHQQAHHPFLHQRSSYFNKKSDNRSSLPITNENLSTPKKETRPASTTIQRPLHHPQSVSQQQQQQQQYNVQMRGGQPTLVQVPSSLAGEEFSRAIVAETSDYRPTSITQDMQSNPDIPGSIAGGPTSATQTASGDHQTGGSGHEAPEWSRTTSSTVLLTCTLLYAAIAEILVNEVDVVLEGASIPEKFLGVSLFALVPNTTEFMNAMSFALNGNIALSMEISSAYALQVCLLQIPAMVLFSALTTNASTPPQNVFVLIFPRWDAIAIIFSVFLLTYMLTESRSNYYRGTILILSYLVLTAGFYFAPVRNKDYNILGDKFHHTLSGISNLNDNNTSIISDDTSLNLIQKVYLHFYSFLNL